MKNPDRGAVPRNPANIGKVRREGPGDVHFPQI